MTKLLDLHGLSTEEAYAKVQCKFFEFDENIEDEELLIMVGKGTGAMKIVVEDLLDEKSLESNMKCNTMCFIFYFIFFQKFMY